MMGIKLFVVAIILALGVVTTMLAVHLHDTAEVRAQARADIEAMRGRFSVQKMTDQGH